MLVVVSALTLGACGGKRAEEFQATGRADASPPASASPSPFPPERDPLPPNRPVDPPCPREELLTSADLDAEVGWKAPHSEPSACTEADVAQFGKNLNDTTIVRWTELAKNLTASCASCVVTTSTDASWGVVVVTAGTNGDRGFINWGACAAVVGGDACGKARQYEELCLSAACNECTATRSERADCHWKAQTGGMCTDFASETSAACPDSGVACGTEIDVVRTVCGPKNEDGGS